MVAMFLLWAFLGVTESCQWQGTCKPPASVLQTVKLYQTIHDRRYLVAKFSSMADCQQAMPRRPNFECVDANAQ